jgi:pimeloyl-ACP methyl ester carboxylesterase
MLVLQPVLNLRHAQMIVGAIYAMLYIVWTVLTRRWGAAVLSGLLIVCPTALSAGVGPSTGRIEITAPGQAPVSLYAEEAGNGPPLLLLHGLGASTFTWRHIVPVLARDHHVIALDLKGFGRSDKPFDDHYSAADQAALVAAFIRKRDLTGVSVIGHSFGGTVALLTALEFKEEPERISRLVVIGAPALKQNFPGAAEIVNAPLVPYLAMTIAPEFAARQLLRAVSAPRRKLLEADIIGYAAPYSSVGSSHAFVATTKAILDANTGRMSSRYPEIRQPTLFVWCRHDRVVPLATGSRLARLLPNARLDVLNHCNHLPQDEVPDSLVADLQAFFNRRG